MCLLSPSIFFVTTYRPSNGKLFSTWLGYISMKRMKIIYTGFLLAAVLLAPSCGKLDKLIQFNLTYNVKVVIPSSTGINLPFDVLTPEVETNSEASFKANDTRKDLIEEILLEELILTIDAPAGEDFSFLKNATVYIKAKGLDELEVATITDVKENSSELKLQPSSLNIAPYIKAEEFSLRLKAVTDELMSKDYTINIYSNFWVHAKLLN